MSVQNYHKIFLYIRETKVINWIQNKETNKQKRTTKGKWKKNINVIIFNLGIRRGTEFGKDRTLAWHTELSKRSWGMRAQTVQQGHNNPEKSKKSFCGVIHLSVWALPHQHPKETTTWCFALSDQSLDWEVPFLGAFLGLWALKVPSHQQGLCYERQKPSGFPGSPEKCPGVRAMGWGLNEQRELGSSSKGSHPKTLHPGSGARGDE